MEEGIGGKEMEERRLEGMEEGRGGDGGGDVLFMNLLLLSLTSSFSILASFINRTSSCTSKLKRGPMKEVK